MFDLDDIPEGPAPHCQLYHPDAVFHPCDIPCWPWRGFYCTMCEEVQTDWNWILTGSWYLLVSWWWDGRTTVYQNVKVKPPGMSCPVKSDN